MFLSEKEIAELPDDSPDIYKRNIIDRYKDRPSTGIYEIVGQLCFAEFIKGYQLAPKSVENDSQPEELVDEIIEVNHTVIGQYPKTVQLIIQKRN